MHPRWRHLVLSDLADSGNNLIVEGSEVLLVGSEEGKEISSSFAGDGGDVGGSVLDEGRGQGLDLVEGVTGNGGDVADDFGDGGPGSATEGADLVPDVREETTAGQLVEEGGGSGLEELGQVQLGNQVLGVGQETVDGGLEIEVLDEVDGITDDGFATEETTEKTAEQVGEDLSSGRNNVGSEALELSPGVLELLDDIGGHFLTSGDGILDLVEEIVGVLFELLDQRSLDVRSSSGQTHLEQGLAHSGLSTLDQVGRESGLGDRNASEEGNDSDLHFRGGFGSLLFDGLKNKL
jgi:hypothetical protein